MAKLLLWIFYDCDVQDYAKHNHMVTSDTRVWWRVNWMHNLFEHKLDAFDVVTKFRISIL